MKERGEEPPCGGGDSKIENASASHRIGTQGGTALGKLPKKIILLFGRNSKPEYEPCLYFFPKQILMQILCLSAVKALCFYTFPQLLNDSFLMYKMFALNEMFNEYVLLFRK